MGFRKDAADLSADMKAAMEEGKSRAELKAAMKAYTESGGTISFNEALDRPSATLAPETAANQLDADAQSKPERVVQADTRQKASVGCGRLILFGGIGLIVLLFVMVILGAMISVHNQRNQRPGNSRQKDSAYQADTGKKRPIKTPVMIETPEARLVERIQTYWLPEVKQWDVRVTDNPATFRDAMTKMDLFKSYLADLPTMKLNAEQSKVVRTYTDALGAKQASILPEMRKQYAVQLDQQLFRSDIRVSVHGAGNRTLRLTGLPFARNANIADTQATLLEAATKLHFKRIEYRWSLLLPETTYYDLSPANDNDVGLPPN